VIADLRDKIVLVTGDTAGVGLATALEFGRRGAHCILAPAGEQAQHETIGQAFAETGAPAPHILPAAPNEDAASTSQWHALSERLRERGSYIEALICAAPATAAVEGVAQYNKADFLSSMEVGAWQLAEQTRLVHEICGRYPRYVVALSSTAAHEYSRGDDFRAASEAALEALGRYMDYHLRGEDIRINILRYRLAQGAGAPQSISEPDVARAVVALCSGLMDCMRGHVLTVDGGGLFSDNLMRQYERGANQH
jgi:NAD(P)-dependent dehydrogenase (short-subunit alcohol dehydrogenase family)